MGTILQPPLLFKFFFRRLSLSVHRDNLIFLIASWCFCMDINFTLLLDIWFVSQFFTDNVTKESYMYVYIYIFYIYLWILVCLCRVKFLMELLSQSVCLRQVSSWSWHFLTNPFNIIIETIFLCCSSLMISHHHLKLHNSVRRDGGKTWERSKRGELYWTPELFKEYQDTKTIVWRIWVYLPLFTGIALARENKNQQLWPHILLSTL